MATGKNKNLTKPMQECIQSVRQHGLLVRWKGGYWTREGCPTKIVDEAVVPEWWYTWGTIKSLIDRDILFVSEENYNTYDQAYYPVAVKLK